jgi:radical SAM-linked protein
LRVQGSASNNPQSAIRNPQSEGPQSSGNAEDWLAGDPNTIAVSRETQRAAVARVRLTYSKLGEARFIGTKETALLFARATRRARLPVAYSQGFHPLPRLSFGPALPLGIESQEEFLDIELTELLSAEEVGRRLHAELPRGFAVTHAEAIDRQVPSIDASIRGFQYTAAVDSLPSHAQTLSFVEDKLRAFQASPQVLVRKHSRSGEKTVDAKQFLNEITFIPPHSVHLEIALTEAGTLKPHEVLGVLFGLTPEDIKVLRLTKMQTLFDPRSAAAPGAMRVTQGLTPVAQKDQPLVNAAHSVTCINGS